MVRTRVAPLLLAACGRASSLSLRNLPSRRALVAGGLGAALGTLGLEQVAVNAKGAPDWSVPGEPVWKKPPQGIQFIAALGDPDASSGSGAGSWGIWREDPGPRGVRLRAYDSLVQKGGKAPAGWTFGERGWWLEEHGLIMEAPAPLPLKGKVPCRYLVTGGRETTAVLSLTEDGSWSLSKGKLFDVTHLPCRSALYTPDAAGGSCTPAAAAPRDFPVTPGAKMPRVNGCQQWDHAVLFVTAYEQPQ